MKEISKVFFMLIGVFMFSCKSNFLYYYENQELLDYESKKTFSVSKNFRNMYLFSRVSTTDYVKIVFHLFNEENSFPKEIIVKNVELATFQNIYFIAKEKRINISEFVTNGNGYYQNVFWIELDKISYPPEEYQKKENKYLTLRYEIDGKQYEEKLIRADKRYPWIMKF